ncbi:alpha/beta hydrolase [Moorena sp. SIO4G3]|uniref:alpha/beta hydrolase n=1 Tax=Moorena sp. SIO4G3 TaxID=2607821 RepID=UPI0014291FAB|nr:alpha/beta hydrolase [Moorena sp. SIO4G3]NEO80553.1 alpha/beta hydrolase [Moorena sp. SIO4G3]
MCSLNSAPRTPAEPRPKQPPKPDSDYISEYKCSIFGTHSNGDYIKAYIPCTPYQDDPNDPNIQNFKAVIYLHGFALGIPKIYETHLLHLVKQGFFVFFPDYQHDDYKDDRIFRIGNMIELIKTVVKSLNYSPEEWIKGAIKSTSDAFKKVEVSTTTKKTLNDSNVDVYLFGHSLGGLLALSWPHYLSQEDQEVQQKLNPLQVIAADPMSDSLSDLPDIVTPDIDSKNLTSNLPFFENPISIENTGHSLTMPVAILHGQDDHIITLDSWTEPFQAIASPNKKIYFSQTDDHGEPNLLANHNQCVTNTSALLYDRLANLLGGSKSEADNLNWCYIWSALDQVIRGTVADQLQFDMGTWSDGKSVKPIQVKPIDE